MEGRIDKIIKERQIKKAEEQVQRDKIKEEQIEHIIKCAEELGLPYLISKNSVCDEAKWFLESKGFCFTIVRDAQNRRKWKVDAK